MVSTTRMGEAEVRAILAALPDPEIPAVSLTEMGMLHEVRWEGETLKVRLRPTYSACPATAVIRREVERALSDRGIAPVEVSIVLAPAWTTDDITPEGREKLRAYGIAPPGLGEVACPRCGSTATRLISQFGAAPCRALWRCEDCLEPFDYMKPHR
jgi:ring-1,2-phenylacetyl-CoA epoxidase subunit PaaD